MNALSQNTSQPSEQSLMITPASGRDTVDAPAEFFTGSVKLEMLFTPAGPDRTSAGLVTFPAGARTHWHSHPLGQTLVVTAGTGYVQRAGGPLQPIRSGDVVRIPPEVKHWHGAASDSSMNHIAIQEALDGKSATWQEAVSDADYLGGKLDVNLSDQSPP
ncbi:(R)-mandelonitrile lyase [Chromobacterium subtsugae]|uniref:(R)-mandelonitrile lyase n=1 Tax=Chromobacterium subtsugae TaxID=251747 RepID=UPI000640F525|nr:cupin domain-containing protein [Chromobacterium subtsugae]